MRHRQWGWLLAACTLTSGCTDPGRLEEITPQPHYVQSFDEAGSVHLAVLSSIPFPRMESELQPRFQIDEAKALEEVVPNTQLLTQRVLDVVERSLRLTTPQPGAAPDAAPVPGAAPGAAPVPGGARTAPGLPAGTPPTLSDRAIDPFTKYKAATALLQEIRLLSQYVVAQQLPPNTKAQVVRLQISVLPYARAQPYDVYTNISFFPESGDSESAKQLLTLDRLNDYSRRGVALVIPLLATDNFEASSQSASAEAVQQAALSLLGQVKGFGIGADFGHLLDQLRSVSGRDINALLTVSKLNSNTLRVRMGAPFSTRTGNAMVPQNYHVSAVVVVPEETSRVDVLARSTLRDALSGKALESRPRVEVLRQACQTLKGYDKRLPGNPTVGVSCEELEVLAEKSQGIFSLLTMVEGGQFSDFQCSLLNLERDTDARCIQSRQRRVFTNEQNDLVAAAWASLVELSVGSHLSRAWFALGSPIWPPAQYVIANDDGTTLTATVSGGRDLPKNLLSAQLTANNKYYPPISTSVEEGGSAVKAVFPSLKLLKPKPSADNLTLDLTNNGTGAQPRTWPGVVATSTSATQQYTILYQQKKPEPAAKPKGAAAPAAPAPP